MHKKNCAVRKQTNAPQQLARTDTGGETKTKKTEESGAKSSAYRELRPEAEHEVLTRVSAKDWQSVILTKSSRLDGLSELETACKAKQQSFFTSVWFDMLLRVHPTIRVVVSI